MKQMENRRKTRERRDTAHKSGGFLLLLVLLLTSALSHGQERVRAGYSGISGYQVPLWLAVDVGLFKKYGLIVDPPL